MEVFLKHNFDQEKLKCDIILAKIKAHCVLGIDIYSTLITSCDAIPPIKAATA
jgi:hypothetical protein